MLSFHLQQRCRPTAVGKDGLSNKQYWSNWISILGAGRGRINLDHFRISHLKANLRHVIDINVKGTMMTLLEDT